MSVLEMLLVTLIALLVIALGVALAALVITRRRDGSTGVADPVDSSGGGGSIENP